MDKKKHIAYNTWCNMKARCYNKNAPVYEYYGARGIDMWIPWKNSSSLFLDWFDRQSLPNSKWSIDRIDNLKGYYPTNCRIVDYNINNQNRRKPSNNKSGYRGVHFNKFSSSWRSSIRWNKQHYSLGYYDTAKEAAIAYNDFVIVKNTNHTINIIKH